MTIRRSVKDETTLLTLDEVISNEDNIVSLIQMLIFYSIVVVFSTVFWHNFRDIELKFCVFSMMLICHQI